MNELKLDFSPSTHEKEPFRMYPDMLYQEAVSYLRRALDNPQADFRKGQWEAIRALVQDRAQCLVVQRTGWGKSMVYFITTRLLRNRGEGPTLIISPLLALMRNQVEAANRLGLRATTLNSSNQEAWDAIEDRVDHDRVDLLLISPERLFNPRFQQNVLARIAARIGLFVVDEAHCISDWGHDFRPEYRRIMQILQVMPSNVRVLATTATANDRVVDDVKNQLGAGLGVIRGPLGRTSLRLQTLYLPHQAQRLAWLAHHVPGLPGSGIIYTRTKRDAEKVANWLTSQGIPALAYHSGIGEEEADGEDDAPSQREQREQMLQENAVKALVATSALGMGYDKPDLGFVIHYQRPGSVVAYYQQVGRAGRAIAAAYGILLSGDEDDEITDYFIRKAHPPLADVQQVLTALDEAPGALSVRALEKEINLGRRDIGKVLDIINALSPSPIKKEGGRWTRTAIAYHHDQEKIDALQRIRRAEQAEMQAYMENPVCLQYFLQRALDDPTAAPCGRCAVCTGGPLVPEEFPQALVFEAAKFLRHCYRVITPRKQWPGSDLMVVGPYRFSVTHGAEEGRALGSWRDGGWGEMVYQGKYHHDHFDDALVKAAAEMIQDDWRPDPPPTWVTCVPSLRRPRLVPEFARRLADHLGLPFVPCIEKVQDTPEQKQMQNSAQQVANLRGVFRIQPVFPQGQEALLVDDMVDSRWTFTVLAALLREAGTGRVYPLALANTSKN